MAGVGERLQAVHDRILRAGGDPDAITIVAVTKGHGPPAVAEAVEAGLLDLGENYVSEFNAKAREAPTGVRWHMVGGLQRRNVVKVAAPVHLWHSVDRPRAAAAVASVDPGGRTLVQIEVSGRPGRSGCAWEEAPGLVEHLRSLDLDVRGLMCIGDPDDPRPGFRRMAQLARSLELDELSMGMSDDLEVAVEEGATMLRLGTALFGPRSESADLRR